MNDYHEYDHEIARARQHAEWLKEKISKTSNPEAIKRMSAELIRLFKASHEDHWGIGRSRQDCEVPGLVRCPVHDSAYTLTNVPTRDAGIHFRRSQTADQSDPAVELIVAALKDLVVRCDKLDAIYAKRGTFRAPTTGPGELAHRVL